LPKLKFIGAGNADELGGVIRLAGGRAGNGFGAGDGLASDRDGFGAGDGLTRGGGNGSGACSTGGGATTAGDGISTGGGASTGAGGGGAGIGGASTGGAGLVGSSAGGNGSAGTGFTGSGAGGGGAVAGGVGRVGGGVTGPGALNAGGANGVAWRLGFGSVGPLFRPPSNSIVTWDGGGSCSDVGSRRIVSSSRRPIVTWTSSETRTARRIRHGFRRGVWPASASIRRTSLSGMVGSLSMPQQEQALLPEQIG
jgi:hypothetical protein